MQIGILGPLRVEGRDGAVTVGGARLRTLLLRLAVEPGHTVHTDLLGDALWGDAVPADPANALQTLVSRLRRVLAEPDTLQSTPTGYRLAVSADDVDATRFERLAAAGHDALDVGDAERAVRLLREALGLWRGRALEEVADAPFAVATVTRLEQAQLAASEDCLEAELALGHAAAVVTELDALAREHPLRERLRALQVRALGAAGRQAEALAAYDDVRRRLADELGVDPSAALQEAQLAVLRGETEGPSASRAAATNLRSALTSFVGRDADASSVRRLLEGSRLVTLVGPGGAGKTRLAVETGAALMRETVVDDGVWLVELAPVSDPVDIAQAVLGSLTLREKRLLDNRAPTAPRDALARLVDAFSSGSALLVLDNCEHLVEGAARLAEHLLGRCPDLRVLATSREPLGILGESLFPVPPLGQPAPDATAEVALTFPAVRLLVDRATAVRPGFVVDDDTVADVVEIVRRLDGLPLAIELAAARLRVLSVHQVADRLTDRFRLLTGGNRTAVPRHQTLRAVVAWSWDLLTDDERRLAEQLSVFAGGATLDAAERVSGHDDVLDLVSALTDKSLVQTAGGAEPRYRMLETIREYGVERLAERGVVHDARRAHAAYYLDLAEQAEPELRGHDQIRWIDRLGAERDNLLSALRFAVDDGDATTAVRLGAALGWYWSLLGSHAEAHAWLALALDTSGDVDPAYAEAQQVAVLQHTLSGFASGQVETDLEHARDLLATKLAGIDGTRGHPMLALVAAGAAMISDDPNLALREIERNLAHPDPWARAALTLMRAALGENSGDVAALRRDGQSGYDQFAAIGDRWGMATCLSSLAWVRMIDGDLEGAVAAYERSIELVGELHAGDDVTEQLLRLGAVRARAGDLAGARRDVERAHAQVERRHSAFMAAFVQFGLGDICRLEGDLGAARAHFAAALENVGSSPIGPPQVRAIVLSGIALLDLLEGRLTTGHERLLDALDTAFVAQDMPIVALVLVNLARHAQLVDDPVRAATLVAAAAAVRGAEDRSDPETARVERWAVTTVSAGAYAAARARGLAMSRAEARAFAETGTAEEGVDETADPLAPAAVAQARRR